MPWTRSPRQGHNLTAIRYNGTIKLILMMGIRNIKICNLSVREKKVIMTLSVINATWPKVRQGDPAKVTLVWCCRRMVGLSMSGNQELHADIMRLFVVIYIMHYNICEPSRNNSIVEILELLLFYLPEIKKRIQEWSPIRAILRLKCVF